jgi:NTP pyrophosphatase (non-canonical NTP hydrolase)
MNWEKYKIESERTLSKEFHCEEKYQRLLHAAIGILTEIEEILPNYENNILISGINDQGSISEEISDVAWYIAILFREYKISFELDKIESYRNSNDILNDIIISTIKILDPLKKKLFYNKKINDYSIIEFSIKLYSLVLEFCHVNGVDLDESLEKNIQKLKVRYGDKFTSEKAINRDLKTEREILEGNSKAKENFDTWSLYLDGATNHRRSGTSQHYID